MADLVCAGARVLRASIVRPRLGAWTADLVLDAAEPPTGAVELTSADGALALHGTVTRGAAWQGRAEVRVVGGAAGLDAVLAPRAYRDATVRVVVADLLRECGEALAADADAAALATALPFWTREAEPARDALARVLERTGAAWRVRDDGAVWIGPEAWGEVEVPGDVLDLAPRDMRAVLGTDTVYGLLAPGTTWLGQRVSLVEHVVTAERVRTHVTFEPVPTAARPARGDELAATLEALVRRSVREVLYHALWPAEVLSQEPDGTLSLRPEGGALPQLVGVPLRYPSPGMRSEVAAGARVLVGFEAGDPARPFACAFAPDNAPSTGLTLEATSIKLGASASRGVVRLNDSVGCGSLTATAPSGGGAVVFTYTPEGGAPLPPSPALTIAGKTTSASSKTTAE